jgi:UDP-N-acetylmuramoyl-tripeptide--D-alanyl-D-alanine ligase
MMSTLQHVASVVAGKLHGSDAEFSAVSTDTRSIASGQLFFALRGDQFDAAEFVGQAAQAGAVGAIVEKFVDVEIAQVEVEDTRVALGGVARDWRLQSGAAVIGITGSNGKTTVKELTATMLRVALSDDAVLATRGNLNNEIGLPLTLLELREQHQVAVVELGASKPGDIEILTAIALPNIAVITNVARAHLEGFGNVDVVADTKGALLSGLDESGVAILNADDAFFASWVERAAPARVVSFGLSSEADYRAENIQPIVRKGRPGFAFDFACPAGAAPVAMPLAGRHNVVNALAAGAAAMVAGADLEHVSAGLALAENVRGRLRAFRSESGAVVFDDSYNANPDSVAAAIMAMAEFKGKTWLVLGDMGELGADAVEMHQATGKLARESGAESLFCIGKLGREIAAGFGPGARWFETLPELEAALGEELLPGRNVLIKASRFMGLDELVRNIEAASQASAQGQGA